MAKRFTDTEIWEQDWFIDLPNKYKLLWNYIKDKCDNVGIWRPNKSILQKIVGEPINLDEFLGFVNIDKERLKVLPSGRWWIKDFFVFQYGNRFSPESNVHKGALKALVQNGIHINEIFQDGIGNLKYIDFQELRTIAYAKDIKSLSVAFGNPIERVKDKEQDKDNYKVKEDIKGKEVKEENQSKDFGVIELKQPKQVSIPSMEEFLDFCKEHMTESGLNFLEYEYPLKSKFDSWRENGWKDGHNKPIKNWKSKIKNVIPFLKPIPQKHSQTKMTEYERKLEEARKSYRGYEQ